MSKAVETRNVVAYCYGNEILAEMLPHMLEQLEVCQKALSGYLDQKRASFPRFYFVSDASLLELLAQSINPTSIQPHLQLVFAAVVHISFDSNSKFRISELHDSLGESMKLEKPVEIQVRTRCSRLENSRGTWTQHMPCPVPISTNICDYPTKCTEQAT